MCMSGASPALACRCGSSRIPRQNRRDCCDIDVWMIRTLVPSRPDTPFAYYAAQFLGGFFILAKNHNWHVIRSYLHLGLHFLVPAIISAIFFREKFVRAWVTMSATMMVDVDHLLADPVYDPTRCSIGRLELARRQSCRCLIHGVSRLLYAKFRNVPTSSARLAFEHKM